MASINKVRFNGTDYDILKDELETKAEIDGYYDSLGVGMADQLASNKYTEDNEPYVYRTSGGSADIGDREYDEIVGGTVAWNQQLKTLDQLGGLQYVTRNYADGVATYTPTDYTKTSKGFYTTSSQFRSVADHVYFMSCDINPDYQGVFTMWIVPARNTIPAGSYTRLSKIQKPASANAFTIYLETTTWSDGVFRVRNCMCIDLTQMFGTAVADAIYALEQAEAGAGVAWFKKLFPKDYYEYNAGELVSVSALQSHDMVGFNQWDEEWENGSYGNDGAKVSNPSVIRCKNLIPVLPNTTYYFMAPVKSSSYTARHVFYDADGEFISTATSQAINATFTTPANCYYFAFNLATGYGTTYNNDICINLSWSGWRNGEYEAYDKHSYPLDSSLTLRGIPKVDSAGNMYYDGDIYSHDGTVTRRYGVVVYDGSSDEVWRVETASGGQYEGANFYISPPSDKLPYVGNTEYARKYMTSIALPSITMATDAFIPTNSYFNFVIGKMLNIQSVADFKTYLSTHPITVVYPLATPTTETAEPYASPQIVDDFGTEEYVSTADIPIPVGHNTKYMANLRDKLVHLPNLADSDGAYLIQQTGHTMELVKFRIPKAPTADGTYTLKATVSGGTPTYTWVSDETEGGNEA